MFLKFCQKFQSPVKYLACCPGRQKLNNKLDFKVVIWFLVSHKNLDSCCF